MTKVLIPIFFKRQTFFIFYLLGLCVCCLAIPSAFAQWSCEPLGNINHTGACSPHTTSPATPDQSFGRKITAQNSIQGEGCDTPPCCKIPEIIIPNSVGVCASAISGNGPRGACNCLGSDSTISENPGPSERFADCQIAVSPNPTGALYLQGTSSTTGVPPFNSIRAEYHTNSTNVRKNFCAGNGASYTSGSTTNRIYKSAACCACEAAPLKKTYAACDDAARGSNGTCRCPSGTTKIAESRGGCNGTNCEPLNSGIGCTAVASEGTCQAKGYTWTSGSTSNRNFYTGHCCVCEEN